MLGCLYNKMTHLQSALLSTGQPKQKSTAIYISQGATQSNILILIQKWLKNQDQVSLN